MSTFSVAWASSPMSISVGSVVTRANVAWASRPCGARSSRPCLDHRRDADATHARDERATPAAATLAMNSSRHLNHNGRHAEPRRSIERLITGAGYTARRRHTRYEVLPTS